jgi:ankyrin repeat protein
MDRSDRHHVDGKAFEPIERDADDLEKGGHAQTSMRSLLNFRDHKGRTALHIAAIWNNKAACETLLYLRANPLIEDGAGYRPVDYANSSSAIADLLKNFMARATPPILTPFGDNDVSIKSG